MLISNSEVSVAQTQVLWIGNKYALGTQYFTSERSESTMNTHCTAVKSLQVPCRFG